MTLGAAVTSSPDLQSFRSAARAIWSDLPSARRCRVVAAARHDVAAAANELVTDLSLPQHRSRVETLAAELIPLCDALRFIGRRGPRVLATRRLGRRGRPAWLVGVGGFVERVPRGVALVIASWNYPFLLAGVQVAQALAAGNAVLWKPAPGCEAASERLAGCFFAAGVPRQALQVLGSDASEGIAAIDAGVDFVVLTGSAATGRRVLAQAAERLTPATVELSGCDAVIVLDGANLRRAAAAVRFGLGLRNGATCIGPRRLLVAADQVQPLVDLLRDELKESEEFEVHPAARSAVGEAIEDALQRGGVDLFGQFDPQRFELTGRMRPLVIGNATPEMRLMHSDVFGPVAGLCPVANAAAAIEIVNGCPYGLAASVFGPQREALQVAGQLAVGSVTVNDAIAPTADPRVPFGGRRDSGFGVTRGAEGLLEMTVPRVISVRHRGPTPHLVPTSEALGEVLFAALQIQHGGGWATKWSGLRHLTRGVRLTAIRPPSPLPENRRS